MTEEQHQALHSVRKGSRADHPHSFAWHPVHKEIGNSDSEIVGFFIAGMAWDVSLRNLLPENMTLGIFAVLRNNCGQTYTYLLQGREALYLGEGDLHDKSFENSGVIFDLSKTDHADYADTEGHCLYTLSVYPSTEFRNSALSKTPEIFAGIIAGTFFLVFFSFFYYDSFVQRRNKKLVTNAARSNAIVTSLFPENVRDRLAGQQGKHGEATKEKARTAAGKSYEDVPIADLFLESTVMFADIVGFTAWSSVREPAQVFTLLETLYGAFDVIAEKRRVFKVETVGDCYVAATGIPTYRKDHAIAMVRFARDILNQMHILSRELEVTLGPDTGDLNLRIGIHSGPVTAGVLRGKKSRFQLFGDTMNTAARIESSSLSGKIQLSSETAKFIIEGGKEQWIEKRPDPIFAKGKGTMETYFVRQLRSIQDSSSKGSSHDHSADTDDELDSKLDGVKAPPKLQALSDKTKRLVDWNTETLLQLLRRIVASRHVDAPQESQVCLDELGRQQGDLPFEEIKEVIHLPEFDSEQAKLMSGHSSVKLDEVVEEELRDYVTCIAKMYRDNAFHNFEHASHVTMSVTKLLSRIVAPSNVDGSDHNVLHDHTYGITSDPLTQFACAFSALIHDVDHTGVPNAQLVKEKATFASVFKEKSVAEQNSLVLSWDLLMDDQFKNFRRVLFQNKAELLRFRELVVNSVMATDIADKDLKVLRNDRWAKAFDQEVQSKAPAVSGKEEVDRKATIVIEHLIQASDISHTMQHWHIYRKWNERLFIEMYQAYVDGRSSTDPSTFWYKGEIGFFDFYIIPLTKKLKECGVFGISSDEYLNYALKNREEWELRGQEIVSEMMEKIPSLVKKNISDN